MAGINQLIINSAFREPAHHWKYDLNGQTFVKEPGRRPAGYFIAGQGSNQYNDIGQFIELPLVNKIRPRVKAWRQAGYPGVTGVTQKLLDHWNDKDARQYQFFFCQMDAIETIIWLTEAPEADKVGIEIPGDGGLFRRICTKLCTGGGKTTVMAMLIAWMVCNKATYPQDKRFSKNVFIVAPGLTVKSRLQVLQTGGEDNYYTQFNVVPIGLMDKLRQGKVLITNWQALAWDSEEAIKKRRSVDKRGAKSDEAYTREVLGEMANAQNILVINDEAHHAWRKNPENKGKLTKEQKEAEQEATIWISGLDRIHKTRSILTCYDFSATPFAPSGKKNDEEALFGWIVSDFGLNDGIESGLVKTPRVVVRDDGMPDAATFRSKLYHIYADDTVKDDSAANFMLKAIQNRREVRNHEIKSIPTTWKGTPASLENLGSDFSLSVMCVGQGSWNEIFDTAGNYTIFDCGTFLSASSQERAECLKQNGGLVKLSAKVTSLIISHWDCDHYNLLRNISDTELSQLATAHFPNQLVSLTSLDIAKRIYKCCQKTEAIVPPRSSQRSSRLKNYCHGQRYRLYIGEARKSLNHSGTALEVHSEKECALLTADHTYKQIFEDMYPNTDKDLILNMVVPHHGGNAGQIPSPIYIYKPGIAIISTDGVSYGHPLPKVMNRLKTEGFQIYRTDVIGTNITLTL